jgi:hypothetical protein
MSQRRFFSCFLYFIGLCPCGLPSVMTVEPTNEFSWDLVPTSCNQRPPEIVVFNLLQSVIPTWQGRSNTDNQLKWSPRILFGVRSSKNRQLCKAFLVEFKTTTWHPCLLACLLADLLTYLPTYLPTHSLTHSLHGAEYNLKSWLSLSLSKKYPAFLMEPEGSSPCSQKTATVPYCEPVESSSPHQSLSP